MSNYIPRFLHFFLSMCDQCYDIFNRVEKLDVCAVKALEASGTVKVGDVNSYFSTTQSSEKKTNKRKLSDNSNFEYEDTCDLLGDGFEGEYDKNSQEICGVDDMLMNIDNENDKHPLDLPYSPIPSNRESNAKPSHLIYDGPETQVPFSESPAETNIQELRLDVQDYRETDGSYSEIMAKDAHSQEEDLSDIDNPETQAPFSDNVANSLSREIHSQEQDDSDIDKPETQAPCLENVANSHRTETQSQTNYYSTDNSTEMQSPLRKNDTSASATNIESSNENGSNNLNFRANAIEEDFSSKAQLPSVKNNLSESNKTNNRKEIADEEPQSLKNISEEVSREKRECTTRKCNNNISTNMQTLHQTQHNNKTNNEFNENLAAKGSNESASNVKLSKSKKKTRKRRSVLEINFIDIKNKLQKSSKWSLKKAIFVKRANKKISTEENQTKTKEKRQGLASLAYRVITFDRNNTKYVHTSPMKESILPKRSFQSRVRLSNEKKKRPEKLCDI